MDRAIAASANDPATLTVRVPQGNVWPAGSWSMEPTQCRDRAPAAPPMAISSASMVLPLHERLPGPIEVREASSAAISAVGANAIAR
jgi:hypothetical protein